MMVPTTEPVFTLLDAQQRELGHIEVERQEGALLTGHFTAAPAFANVERL